MDHEKVQAALYSAYRDWKSTHRFSKEHADSLDPPFLLHVTEDYCRAKMRILAIGQEARYWGFSDEKSKSSFRAYPVNADTH
jgi:hypothetical protein